ncbi:MAG: hypothetical protein IPK70_09945 [Flavobacteriales bacterium]|jgi:hypothetical protein|nr:hypothetical protein [Flavobacteriales bacterium]
MDKQATVTDTMLDDAYAVMARIIRDGGDKYLPIFKRLHEEKEMRKATNDLKKVALHVAADMIP